MKIFGCMILVAVVAAWLAGARAANASTDVPAIAAMTDWSNMVQVNVPAKPAAGLVEVDLSPEVLAAARLDLADLRLVGPSEEVVPYVTRVDRGEAERSVSYQPSRMFNATFVPRVQSTVTIDFGAKATRSRVNVDTPGSDFRRRVMVEASDDGNAWQVLVKTAWLFRIAYDTGDYDKSQIDLSDNDFRYLRITVYNDSDDAEQVHIQSVTAWYLKNTPPKVLDVPTRSVTVAENSQLKATEIEADLGYANLPLQDALLAFDDANFLRRVEIFGRNVKTRTIVEPVENAQPRTTVVDEPWTSLAQGSVYRLPAGAGQEATIGESLTFNGPYRYLMFRIYNEDDAPLKFHSLSVHRLKSSLDFRADAAGAYRLYVGNPGAQGPQYDLGQYVDRLRAEGVSEATLGALATNPLFKVVVKPAPWSERYAWLLWVILLVVVAVLGILVIRQGRQAKAVGQG